MRKLYTGILALMMLGACNPMEDIYDELDQLEKPISKELEYTLTDADYGTVAKEAYKLKTKQDSAAADYIKKNKAFSEQYGANQYLGGLFSSLYPGLKDGSSVKATYNFYEGAFPDVEKVTLGIKNYQQGGKDIAKYLCLSEKEASGRLDSALVGLKLEDKALALITCKVTADRSGKTENVFDFTMDKYDYQILVDDVKKNHKEWLTDKGDSEFYYGASSYNKNFSAKKKDWEKYNKGVVITDDFITGRIREGVELLLKTKFKKDAVAGVVYNVRYSVYDNKNLPTQMAFKCTKADGAPEFEFVEDIDAVETYEVTNLYEYSTKYKNYTIVKETQGYVVSDEDFDGMGIKDHSFSSSNNSKNYLPQFLSLKFPYAQPGAKCIVAYKNDNDKKYSFYTDEYTFTDGVWTAYNPTVVKTDQFIFANGAWMFDPSVRFTMVQEDYQVLVDWVAENKPAYLDSKYPDQTEYWFGASSYQKNFDMRISRTTKDPEGILKDKSDEEVNAILLEQVKKGIIVLLETKFPDAVTQKDGVDMYYKVTYQTFDGNRKNFMMSFKCIDTGKFEFAEGPTQL